MTSGVYELKFSNGARYIGKSINIENRWRQHFDKFIKGTAAKNMQDAFNKHGAPEGDILCTCHPDHIDILEACYIARHKPELNSDRPADPFPNISAETLDDIINNTVLFDISTWDHIATLDEFRETIRNLKAEVEELTILNDQLLEKRSSEEILSSAGSKLRSLSNSITTLNRELIESKDTILTLEEKLEYERLSWWKKLFH